MSTIKKIGIIGYGKMGRDIFSAMHAKMTDAEFTVILRHDAETETAQVLKELDKSLRRKRISEDIYKKRKENFVFTDDLNRLEDSDLIIETVTENESIKKSLFGQLEKITRDDCVFATNTSSLRTEDVFSDCDSSRDTMGLHFFYPIKLSSAIELNNCKNKSIALQISEALDKKSVFFEGEYSCYLNQFISFAVSYGIIIAEKNKISIEQLMDIINDIFPVHKLFGMVDSIGLCLLTSGKTEYNVRRIKDILDKGREKMAFWISEGCQDKPGHFLDFITEYEKNIEKKSVDEELIRKSFLMLLMNEAVKAAEENDKNIVPVLNDVLGMSESFEEIFSRYGYDAIDAALDEAELLSGTKVLIRADKDSYKNIFEN
ncbi:MAG: hypothetical protein E7505_03860 [Ruminococcus sp.]|nr:hypothetical protein [Ruminococcus sp.]